MQKVLVVLPFYGGSLPIGRYCQAALKQLGCIVETFESPDFFSAFTALKDLRVGVEHVEYLENNFLHVVSQAICAKAETFQPDLVLAMAQAPLSRNALKRLKKEGIATAMWFMEDYRLFTYWRAFAPYYDIFAVIQKEPFLSELKSIGVENALYLPLAALPELHAPLTLNSVERVEYGADVSFLGAGYPNRLEAFSRLVEHIGKANFKIWGTEWEAEPRLAPYVQRGGARIAPEEAVKIYNASDINVNLHSSVQAESLVSKGDFVNPRTFELACAGVFQLVDQRGLMDELFAHDELARFASFAELVERINYFRAHPEERLAIAEKGRARVLQEHQYTHRMDTLLSFAARSIPDFGQHTMPEYFQKIPGALSDSLMNVMAEAGLPPEASFEDVLAVVKQKQGRLSDLETALLFLDEWKKQYLPR